MQSGNPSKQPSRRRHARTPARVVAHWHNRVEEGVPAVIYDVSAEGFFLVPEGTVPPSLRNGDTVWVAVRIDGADASLSGTVRWSGAHPAYQLIGCGIQVEGSSVELLHRAFPELHRGESLQPDAPGDRGDR
jgi:hypothetical protein